MAKRKEYIPVFVGSTYSDLIEYRKSVMETLHKLQTIVNGMEYFGSKPGSPIEECLNALRDSKVYIGVFAMRYGSIEEAYGKSFTHLEYLEAQRINLPSLIYIIDDDRQPMLAKNIEQGDGARKLARLKEELKRKFVVSFYTTPEDLATKILQDLPPVLKDMGVSIKSPKTDRTLKDLFHRFKVRPKKYHGFELVVVGILTGETRPAYSWEVDELDLEPGDTIVNKLEVNLNGVIYSLDVYCTGNVADEFENFSKGDEINAKLRFLFGVAISTTWLEDESKAIAERNLRTGYLILDVKKTVDKNT